MADSIEVLRAALRYIEHTANGKQELLVEQMRNAIRALSPAGGDWVMVPRKADDAMKLAGWKVIDNAGDRCHQVWNAMLAASPQQEPGPAINFSETYSKPIADHSGQTLAGAYRAALEQIAKVPSEPPRGSAQDRQISKMRSIATEAITATSAGTTGDDSEDAARYRWLRTCGVADDRAIHTRGYSELLSESELDAAIDARRAREVGNG